MSSGTFQNSAENGISLLSAKPYSRITEHLGCLATSYWRLVVLPNLCDNQKCSNPLPQYVLEAEGSDLLL